MATVFVFPDEGDREWREVELWLREKLQQQFSDLPGSAAAIDVCLPRIRRSIRVFFPATSFAVGRPDYSIPGPLTESQAAAVASAVELAMRLVADQYKRQRVAAIVALAAAEFRAALREQDRV